MDKLMMLFGYFVTIVCIFTAVAHLCVLLCTYLKGLFVVRLNKLDEDQLRHLISSASALLEQKRRK